MKHDTPTQQCTLSPCLLPLHQNLSFQSLLPQTNHSSSHLHAYPQNSLLQLHFSAADMEEEEEEAFKPQLHSIHLETSTSHPMMTTKVRKKTQTFSANLCLFTFNLLLKQMNRKLPLHCLHPRIGSKLLSTMRIYDNSTYPLFNPPRASPRLYRVITSNIILCLPDIILYFFCLVISEVIGFNLCSCAKRVS